MAVYVIRKQLIMWTKHTRYTNTCAITRNNNIGIDCLPAYSLYFVPSVYIFATITPNAKLTSCLGYRHCGGFLRDASPIVIYVYMSL